MATDVINNSGIDLSDPAEYAAMFSEDEAVGEVIFKFGMAPGNSRIGEAFYETATRNIFFSPTDDLVDLLEEYSADVRLSVNVDFPADENEDVVGKYPGPSSLRGLADIKVLRLSEMYLIRAEANYQLNNSAQAIEDLDKIVTIRTESSVDSDLSGENLYNAIKEEWRREFAFEGFRWFNLKRWNDPVVRGDDCNTTICEVEASNYRFLFPIPADEIFANPNIVQNPNY
jgi:hypothetical protein